MADIVVILLPGVGTLELSREVYDAALHPLIPSETKATGSNRDELQTELVTAKSLATSLSLPISCIYEYAKAGRIPCVRAGKHVRFNAAQVVAALRATGGATGGHC